MNPVKAVPYFSKAAYGYESIKEFKKAGITFLNLAGVMEEHVGLPDSALFFAQNSLENFLLLGDSMQIANLWKYVGYLNGINGEFDKGIEQIILAADYYRKVGFTEGEAVCNFNLARLAVLQGDYFEADSLLNISENIWLLSASKDRLLLIENVRTDIKKVKD